MKIFKFALLAVIVFTLFSCQKESETPVPVTPATKPSPGKPEPSKSIQHASNCESKEIVKYISETDDSVSRKTFESKQETKTKADLKEKSGNKLFYDQSGEVYILRYVTINNAIKELKSKIDYTFTGTRETETTELGNNKYKLYVKSQSTRTGRNGYQFTKPDGMQTDTSQVNNTTEWIYFDDTRTTYDISQITNGKPVESSYDEITQYETNANVRTEVTTLKTPRIIKNGAGKVVEETEYYQIDCTTKSL